MCATAHAPRGYSRAPGLGRCARRAPARAADQVNRPPGDRGLRRLRRHAFAATPPTAGARPLRPMRLTPRHRRAGRPAVRPSGRPACRRRRTAGPPARLAHGTRGGLRHRPRALPPPPPPRRRRTRLPLSAATRCPCLISLRRAWCGKKGVVSEGATLVRASACAGDYVPSPKKPVAGARNSSSRAAWRCDEAASATPGRRLHA